MNSKLGVRSALLAFLAVSSLASGVALAVYEVERNDPITAPQHLVIGSGGSAQVTGVVGVLSGAATNDVDFYSFEGQAGDVVTVNIDGGIKSTGRSVDTVLAIFGPFGSQPFHVWRQNDDYGTPDAGSSSPWDARIDNFRLPSTGTWIVGVSSSPRMFRDGGTLISSSLNSLSNGSYVLMISGVTPPVQQINIEIKPGDGDIAPINLKSRGSIPVALLSSSEFNALEVDQNSLTFGATGSENSLVRCGKDGEDVDGDGRLDLVCHFENTAAGFDSDTEEGIVKGTRAGRPFEGRGWLKVVPVKKKP
jgi:pre-peptidase